MVEANQDKKNGKSASDDQNPQNKVQLAQPYKEPDTSATTPKAVDSDEEEKKTTGTPKKAPVDQNKSNLPVNPQYDELVELLEENFKKMPKLCEIQKTFLKQGLKNNKFYKTAQMVIEKLR